MRRYEHGGEIYGGPPIRLDFSVNINPLGLPKSVENAIITHMPDYAHYPDPNCHNLVQALSVHHGVPESMILCGNGASELIFALCACLKPKKALVTAPTFSEYERSVMIFGGEVKEHILREDENFALTERIIDEIDPEIDLLFLCNPNNPTGRLSDSELLLKIADACRRNSILLLLDECFIDFTRGVSLLPKLREYPNLLILQAFTKFYAMAGLRLGSLYCADEDILLRIRDFMPTWSVSVVAQAAGIAALKEKKWQEYTWQLIEAERVFLNEALCKLGITVYPSESNFLLIKTQRPLYETLRAKNILLRNCANFSGLDYGFFRIGIKNHAQNEKLLYAIKEIFND